MMRETLQPCWSRPSTAPAALSAPAQPANKSKPERVDEEDPFDGDVGLDGYSDDEDWS